MSKNIIPLVELKAIQQSDVEWCGFIKNGEIRGLKKGSEASCNMELWCGKGSEIAFHIHPTGDFNLRYIPSSTDIVEFLLTECEQELVVSQKGIFSVEKPKHFDFFKQGRWKGVYKEILERGINPEELDINISCLEDRECPYWEIEETKDSLLAQLDFFIHSDSEANFEDYWNVWMEYGIDPSDDRCFRLVAIPKDITIYLDESLSKNMTVKPRQRELYVSGEVQLTHICPCEDWKCLNGKPNVDDDLVMSL